MKMRIRGIIRVALIIVTLYSVAPALAQSEQISLGPADLDGRYIVNKVWLNSYHTPQVMVTNKQYVPATDTLTANTDTNNIIVQVGMERKRPFAVIKVPAYTKNSEGIIEQITSCDISLTQQPAIIQPAAAAKTTANAASSVLSTGTWHKFGITRTGFHKIDAAFLTSLGLNPATTNPANIRIFGNGGEMLSEANFIPRPDDLLENALLVSDNGDNIFNGSDYVVFYGLNTTGWNADTNYKRYSHVKNLYSDTAYYFVTVNQGAGKRITQENATAPGNVTVTNFDYYDAHDIDLVNPAGLGKIWYGEQFNPLANNLTQTFNFDFGAPASNIYCKVSAGNTGPGGSSFGIAINGSTLGSILFSSGTGDNTPIQLRDLDWPTTLSATAAAVSVTFKPSATSALGYLNYVEINARRQLSINSDQLSFRDLNSVGFGKIANYQLQGANANTQIWDITNPQTPVELKGTLSGSTLSFSRDASTLHEFAAMNSLNLFTPLPAGQVANQNLHGSPQVDNIIVTHKSFLQQANQLADYHRSHDNMRVLVSTPEEIYNEFSSGAQDISAIRDFVRMFYLRAGSDSTQMPHYLTLLGGASYDYKNRLPNNSNYVPVFESLESTYTLASVSTDDFYGFLDDNENIETNKLLNTLDIGVGRLPARSVADANAMVNKIINYKTPATLGPWRLASTLVADNNDLAGDHMIDAEIMGIDITATTNNLYNHSKIYIDAIPRISTPAGERSPNASAAISDRVYKGTMLINYSGHGNTQVWAEERILTREDFNKWNNKNTLPFMVTATCDYGQFDHPQYVSAAEQLVILKDAGVISLLTTTAAVYASYNRPLNSIYLKNQLKQKTNGKWHTFGDASRLAKNERYSVSDNPGELANYRKFALLGDPALTPNFPEHNVHIDSIIDVATQQSSTTVKALGEYRVSGTVQDNDGNTLNDFNGILSVSFFDKPRTINTITSANLSFQLQDNLVYKGKVSVVNGRYSYTFIVPKDINYYLGTGKISNYAQNGITDAAGVDTGLAVGGYSDNPVTSDVPPVVKPYINDSFFLNGGITGANTSLFVSLYTETGINVSGTKLGHDLTAVLDGNIEQPYILNDYYETAPNTYKRGFVNFPINGLSNGKHTITVKAWDVNNNFGVGSVDFEVLDGKIISIENLTNYPNPFTNETHFVFEHNHPDEELDVKINIYNTAGALVKNIEQIFTPTGSRTNEIVWNGTDNQGNRLPSGIYVYRLMITTDKGFKSTAYQKLVIAR
jgi:hypothetical protein